MFTNTLTTLHNAVQPLLTLIEAIDDLQEQSASIKPDDFLGRMALVVQARTLLSKAAADVHINRLGEVIGEVASNEARNVTILDQQKRWHDADLKAKQEHARLEAQRQQAAQQAEIDRAQAEQAEANRMAALLEKNGFIVTRA